MFYIVYTDQDLVRWPKRTALMSTMPVLKLQKKRDYESKDNGDYLFLCLGEVSVGLGIREKFEQKKFAIHGNLASLLDYKIINQVLRFSTNQRILWMLTKIPGFIRMYFGSHRCILSEIDTELIFCRSKRRTENFKKCIAFNCERLYLFSSKNWDSLSSSDLFIMSLDKRDMRPAWASFFSKFLLRFDLCNFFFIKIFDLKVWVNISCQQCRFLGWCFFVLGAIVSRGTKKVKHSRKVPEPTRSRHSSKPQTFT